MTSYVAAGFELNTVVMSLYIVYYNKLLCSFSNHN